MKNRSDTLLLIAQFASVAVAVGCAIWLAVIGYRYWREEKNYTEMENRYVHTENASSPQESSTDGAQGANPATDPFDGTLLEIDFEALRAECPGVVGWLAMDDLPIVSYPVMQAEDNDYYLHRAPNGTDTNSGSIFMDAAGLDFDDLHVLLYGHNMKNRSMFGSLREYKEDAFYHNGSGKFTIYTPEGRRRYQIFSVRVVAQDDFAYQLGFARGALFSDFVAKMKENSLYDTGVAVSGEDNVLTLSTCTGSEGEQRLVISAKLTARQLWQDAA